MTDDELLAGLRAGDPLAFEQFVDHYRTRIFQYSYLMCGQREDAEEVSQEALLKVFENFEQLREAERLKAWVFRIARNACLMKRRKSVFAPRSELSLEQEEQPLQIADSAALPDQVLLEAEFRRAMESAIRQLPDIYRSVVLLRDVEGLTTPETARILELGEEAVKSRLHRARLQLRKSLEAYLAPAARAKLGILLG